MLIQLFQLNNEHTLECTQLQVLKHAAEYEALASATNFFMKCAADISSRGHVFHILKLSLVLPHPENSLSIVLFEQKTVELATVGYFRRT